MCRAAFCRTLVVEPHGLPSPGIGDAFVSPFPAPVASPCLHKLLSWREYPLFSLAIKKARVYLLQPLQSLSSPRPTPFPSHSSQSFILSMTLAALYPEYSRAVGQGAMETSRFPLCDISQVGAGLGAFLLFPLISSILPWSSFECYKMLGHLSFLKMDHLCNLIIIQ